jgi:PST family polysaccharide transporter
LSFAILPVMAGLALVAREAVSAIYGDKWTGAGEVLAILSWVGVFQPFTSLAGTVVLARGYSRWFFWWGLIVSALNVASFVVGLHWGITGVAAAYLVVQLLIALIGMPVQYRKVDISVRRLLTAMAEPAAGTMVMIAAVLAVQFALAGRTMLPALRLGVMVAAGALAYVLVLFALRNFFWADLRSDLRRAFGSR